LRVAAALIVLLACPASAQEANPFVAAQAEHVRRIERSGRRPEGLLHLLDLWREAAHVPPARTRESLGRAARRSAPPLRAFIERLEARLDRWGGDLEASRARLTAIGVLRGWRVLGPFDDENGLGFGRAYPPEAAPRAERDFAAATPGRARDVSWRRIPDLDPEGFVDFAALYRPREHVCAYAETVVQSDRARPLSVWVGGGGATRAWWNGEAILSDAAYREPFPDRHAAAVGAHRGANRLLVKVCTDEGGWGFSARVGALDGGPPPPGVRGVGAVDGVAPAGHGVRLVAAPLAPFDALAAAARASGASPQEQERFARLLLATGGDDPATEEARQMAEAAVAAAPSLARRLLALRVARTRGQRMGLARRLAEAHPSAPEAILARARVALDGPAPEAALPILRQLPEGSASWMEGALLEAEILRGFELPRAALLRVRAAAAHAPGTPHWLAAEAAAYAATGDRDRAIRGRERLLALRWDDLGSRRVLLDDRLLRGDEEGARAQLEAYRRVASGRPETYRIAAEVEHALGREDAALRALRDGRELAPEDASLRVAEARLLLRYAQPAAAATALRGALALRPQDTAARELLEQLAPTERRDEAYALDPDALAALRPEVGGGYPYTILHDLTVQTVYPSGLGSRFRQLAVAIHDAEGARRWAEHAIPFDPDVQRVDLRQARVFRGRERLSAVRTREEALGEPWYRVYYDTRARVVSFPDLEPGDVVELRYRVDDVAPRNLFDDYFGDVLFLRDEAPTRRFAYVLVGPESRTFHMNAPDLPGLTRETSTEDGRRIHRFTAEDIAPLRPEAAMPGASEVNPYLHVSTYETWEDVGRWYWGLIEDQLYADAELREVVAGLVEGAPEVRERVRRIYDWVVRNTRYVALEFGIHGFLPYRVPEVVDRGFGDCKDKASLLYAMLEAAGIDARIVLVRTRPRGQIAEAPASLAVFDHAIAYVPALDLYLDGTAEYAGFEELPAMDQGVNVLRVGPDDVVLTRTPMTPPEANRRERTLTLRPRRDGGAAFTLREEVRGAEAPPLRRRYRAEGTRRDRLRLDFGRPMPGLDLRDVEVTGLATFDAPVVVELRGMAPDLALRDGRTLRIAPSLLPELTPRLAPRSERRLPLDLRLRESYRETREVVLPPGYRVGSLPEGGIAESPFGALTLTATGDGPVLLTTELVRRADRVAREDYAAFRAWVEAADRLLRQRLIWRRRGEVDRRRAVAVAVGLRGHHPDPTGRRGSPCPAAARPEDPAAAFDLAEAELLLPGGDPARVPAAIARAEALSGPSARLSLLRGVERELHGDLDGAFEAFADAYRRDARADPVHPALREVAIAEIQALDDAVPRFAERVVELLGVAPVEGSAAAPPPYAAGLAHDVLARRGVVDADLGCLPEVRGRRPLRTSPDAGLRPRPPRRRGLHPGRCLRPRADPRPAVHADRRRPRLHPPPRPRSGHRGRHLRRGGPRHPHGRGPALDRRPEPDPRLPRRPTDRGPRPSAGGPAAGHGARRRARRGPPSPPAARRLPAPQPRPRRGGLPKARGRRRARPGRRPAGAPPRGAPGPGAGRRGGGPRAAPRGHVRGRRGPLPRHRGGRGPRRSAARRLPSPRHRPAPPRVGRGPRSGGLVPGDDPGAPRSQRRAGRRSDRGAPGGGAALAGGRRPAAPPLGPPRGARVDGVVGGGGGPGSRPPARRLPATPGDARRGEPAAPDRR
jgi:transglutaminase-like putative cysteine protease